MPPALYFTVERWAVGCLGSWVPFLGVRCNNVIATVHSFIHWSVDSPVRLDDYDRSRAALGFANDVIVAQGRGAASGSRRMGGSGSQAPREISSSD